MHSRISVGREGRLRGIAAEDVQDGLIFYSAGKINGVASTSRFKRRW